MNQNKIKQLAQEKVKQKKAFYAHFNAFGFVVIIAAIINAVVFPQHWWFMLAFSGWAMAVIGHYLDVFGMPTFRSTQWEEKQYEIEFNKLKQTEKQVEFKLKSPISQQHHYTEDDFV